MTAWRPQAGKEHHIAVGVSECERCIMFADLCACFSPLSALIIVETAVFFYKNKWCNSKSSVGHLLASTTTQKTVDGFEKQP